jgi:hypothetical protein
MDSSGVELPITGSARLSRSRCSGDISRTLAHGGVLFLDERVPREVEALGALTLLDSCDTPGLRERQYSLVDEAFGAGL